jgi:hypothetical protein
MLLVMEKEDFKYERTKQMAMKYFRKMVEYSEEVGNEVKDWEVIPYETLWDKVLNRLNQKTSSTTQASVTRFT